ncbi:EAL domain-containing protein [Thaumasiovibrio subtropicus]|uniref:EAL domain-containing protein n=1 Tax=Thaumasiovibrio subtropicus TaxID=1891207 RepID=UPI00131C7FF9|nr:EAL domain-containing protein [Thaumasiovibrio subtropicus]
MANRALNMLNQELDAKQQMLVPFSIDPISCDKSTRRDLLQAVLSHHGVKEIGLFSSQGRVYCASNYGVVNIPIYASTLNRIHAAENRTTLIYGKAQTNRLPTLFLYVANSKGYGANALMRPLSLFNTYFEQLDELGIETQLSVHGAPINALSSHSIFTLTLSLKALPLEIRFSIPYYSALSWTLLNLFLGLCISLLIKRLMAYQQLSQRPPIVEMMIKGIREQEFTTHFQPIVDSTSHQVIGCEALLRWQPSEGPSIPPNQFIPAAEKYDLIEPLTEQVLNAAIRLLSNPAYLQGYVAINLSRYLLLRGSFVQKLRQLAKQHPHIAKRLVLEVTEERAYDDQELHYIIDHLKTLNQHHYRVAVDDFGTGYSGLDFIRRYPFDILKIDRVFVAEVHKQHKNSAILDTMVQLAHKRQMTVIAEGVEEIEEIAFLSEKGIQGLQGFYFARPAAMDDFIAYCEKAIDKENDH